MNKAMNKYTYISLEDLPMNKIIAIPIGKKIVKVCATNEEDIKIKGMEIKIKKVQMQRTRISKIYYCPHCYKCIGVWYTVTGDFVCQHPTEKPTSCPECGEAIRWTSDQPYGEIR